MPCTPGTLRALANSWRRLHVRLSGASTGALPTLQRGVLTVPSKAPFAGLHSDAIKQRVVYPGHGALPLPEAFVRSFREGSHSFQAPSLHVAATASRWIAAPVVSKCAASFPAACARGLRTAAEHVSPQRRSHVLLLPQPVSWAQGIRRVAADTEAQGQSMFSRLQEQGRLAVAKARAAMTPPKAPPAGAGALPKAPPATAPTSSAPVVERAKRLVEEPLALLSRTANKYRDAAGLQVEAFWRRNRLFIIAGAGVALVVLLWRLMYGVTSTFISVSDAMAKFGFLALSAAVVILAGVYLQHRFTISPDAVYRLAMRRLQTNAAVLEVMGAPLSGSDVRAYVVSGGGLRFKNFRPRFASRRCFLIFPLRGSERRGLVSTEVRKRQGKHDFKLLAVDLPTATDEGPGRDQRLYLEGDEVAYLSSGGVISELRDPIVQAMAKQSDFEAEDDQEAEQEAKERREQEVREAQAAEEAAEKAALAARERAIKSQAVEKLDSK